MQKPSKRTATLMASALGALVLALPVRGSADSSRYYDYSESPYYGRGQSWQNWWQNRPGHDDWSEERGDQRHAWNRLQKKRQEMARDRREGDWSEYQEDKREAQKAARDLHSHNWGD